MSSSIFSVNINDNANKSLSNTISLKTLTLPAKVVFEESNLLINTGQASQSSGTELVVFDTLTHNQLHEIAINCQCQLLQINAINHRLSRTSIRFDINCPHISEARKALTEYCLSQGIEAAIVKDAPKLTIPGVLVMDMDSTTIEIECIDEIAKLAGVGEQVAAVTERAMLGELDFAQSLHQRVATLANAPEQILAEVAKDIPLMDGLTVLIDALRIHQWRIAIASGGFTYFADHLKELLHLDAAYANTLEIIDHKLTGKVLGEVVDAQTKADVLHLLQKEFSIEPTQTVAMGDGANDLIMMDAAQLGVAFRAKPIVQAQADTNLNQSGLDGMIHWLA